MTTEPLSRDRAYDSLVDMILRGEINENDALSERGLSERLGLGRTPIREAIKDLVREGVLESHPMRGTALKALGLADIQDLYEIRFAIEGLAAFLAAERGNVDELAGDRDTLKKVLLDPQQTSLAEIHRIGVDLHYTIIRLSENARLAEMYRPFRIRFGGPFGLSPENSGARILEAAREHLVIIEAVMERRPQAARDHMCQHLRAGLEHRTNILLKRSHYPAAIKDLAGL